MTHLEEFRITNIVAGAASLYLTLKLFTALMQTLQSDDNEMLSFPNVCMFLFVLLYVCFSYM